MKKWECQSCGYIYNSRTPFALLPKNWICPKCGACKKSFTELHIMKEDKKNAAG